MKAGKTWNSYRIPRLVVVENSPPRAPYIEGEIWGNLSCTKLKEGIPSEINSAQFPRKPSTVKYVPLHKSAIECTLRIPKRSTSSHKSINDSAPHTPKRQTHTLFRQRGLGTHRGTRLNWPWHRPESIKILLPAQEAGQQDFEGLLWGQRIWGPQPISYRAHGPCQGGINVQGWTKRIQTARVYCRGRPCPQQTKITEGERATPLEVVSSSIPKEIPSAVSQP